MNATKILWGQIFLVCAVVVGFVWGATEWTAWQLAFQPQLGHPWFTLFGWPVYQPPAFFWWWFAFDAYAHEIFVTGGFIAGAGGVAAFVVAVAMSVWRAREVKKVTTYGSARWAEAREIREAGLLHPDGVLLGRWRGTYLRHYGPEHVLCFAPSRSGKRISLVVPMLAAEVHVSSAPHEKPQSKVRQSRAETHLSFSRLRHNIGKFAGTERRPRNVWPE